MQGQTKLLNQKIRKQSIFFFTKYLCVCMCERVNKLSKIKVFFFRDFAISFHFVCTQLQN